MSDGWFRTSENHIENGVLNPACSLGFEESNLWMTLCTSLLDTPSTAMYPVVVVVLLVHHLPQVVQRSLRSLRPDFVTNPLTSLAGYSIQCYT